MLDAKIHGLALPPGALLIPVEVGQEGGVVTALRVRCVALVAGARWPRLHAEFLRRGAAHIRYHHGAIEGDVLKLGHAAARGALLVIAGVHGRSDQEVAAKMKGEEKAKERRPRSKGCIHADPFVQAWGQTQCAWSCKKVIQQGRGSLIWKLSSTRCEVSNMCSPSVEWNEVWAGSPLIRSSVRQTEEGQGWGWGPEGRRSLWKLPHLLASVNTAAALTSQCNDFSWWRWKNGEALIWW